MSTAARKPTFPTRKHRKLKVLGALILATLVGNAESSHLHAQAVNFDGITTYTQDFNSMTGTSSATYTTLDKGTMHSVGAQANGGTVTGWYFYGYPSNIATTTIRWGANDGSDNTGAFRELVDGAGGHALGSLSSGSNFGFWGLILKNTSGSTINDVALSYTPVINRNPATTANPYPLTFRTTATDIVTTQSTADGTFDDLAGTWSTSILGFTTPSTGTGAPGTAGAIDPIFSLSPVSGNLSGLNWGNNEFLYLRWQDQDNAGGDAAAGIDNFSLSQLIVTGLTWGLSTGGNWDTTTPNWNNPAPGALYTDGSSVTFNNAAGGTINIVGTHSPNQVNVSAPSGTYTFSSASSSDKITGTTGLIKSGAGTLAVTNDNDYTGGTSINEGTVQIDGAGRLGTNTITLGGGTLQSTATGAVVLSNDVSVAAAGGGINTGTQDLTVASITVGAGKLTKTGTGNLTVTGNFAPVAQGNAAGLDISGGNVILAQPAGIPEIGQNSVFNGNLVLNGPVRFNVNNNANITGTGQIQTVASGALISTFSGNIGGTVSVGINLNSTNAAYDAGTFVGNTYIPGATPFTSTVGGTTGGGLTVNGVISGNSDVDYSNNSTGGGGRGFTQLNAAGTYTGLTTMNHNTNLIQPYNVRLGVNNAIPTTSGVVYGTKSSPGAAMLDLNGFNQQVAFLGDASAYIPNRRFLTVSNFSATTDSTFTIGGTNDVLSGSGSFGGLIIDGTRKVSLVKTGINTQAMSGTHFYSGGTTINGGTLIAEGFEVVEPSPGNFTRTGDVTTTNAAERTVSNIDTTGLVVGQGVDFTGDNVPDAFLQQIPNVTSVILSVAAPEATGATYKFLPGGSSLGTGPVTVNTGGNLVANQIRVSSLTLATGATVSVNANGTDTGTNKVSALSITGTGKFDLNDNDLIVDNGNLAALTAHLASGLDISGSYGNGPGITSSAFANNVDFNTVLGIAANSELGYTSFSGQTVDANDVLIKYTYYGDADLSGSVDTSTDFDLYITGLTSGGSLGGWLFGDFDYSGTVDSSTDFDLYITGLTTQGSPLLTVGGGNQVQAVPEPSTFVLGGLALLGFAGVGLRRRRSIA